MPKKAQKAKKTYKKAKPVRSSYVKISEDMPVSEVLSIHPETLAVFATIDLACIGDSSQQSMTLQSWAVDHGVYDVKKFIQKLNHAASSRHSPKRKSPAHKGL